MQKKKNKICKKEIDQETKLANIEYRLEHIELTVLNDLKEISNSHAQIERLLKIVDSKENMHSEIERQIAVLEQNTKIIFRVLYLFATAFLAFVSVLVIKSLF